MTQCRPSGVVAREVRRLRDLRGWSQQKLAGRCADLGMPQLNRSVLANLESGRREAVTLDETLVLAVALDVPPTALFLPLGSAKAVAVTPTTRVHPDLARKWVAGEQPLPGTDLREWYRNRQVLDTFEALNAAQTSYIAASSAVKHAEYLGDAELLRGAKEAFARSLTGYADVVAMMARDGLSTDGLVHPKTVEEMRSVGVELPDYIFTATSDDDEEES